MTLEDQLDINHRAFRQLLPELLTRHRGQVALFRDGALEGVFDRAADALQEGYRRFPDRLFSVQEVQEPAELGVLSHGVDLWAGI